MRRDTARIFDEYLAAAARVGDREALGLFAGGFYAAWMFLTVGETNEVIRWGGISWFLLTGVYLMKLWFWMQMETNRILREVKRVELQLARMQSKQIV